MPIVFSDPIGWVQLILIATIIYQGIRQYFLKGSGADANPSFVIPLGALCLIFGFIGMIIHIRQAFEAIEIAGDISPQIVASAIKHSYDFPILGLVGLATSYAFRYINSSIVNARHP